MGGACTVDTKDDHQGAVLIGDTNVTIGGKPAAYVGADVSPDPKKGHTKKKIITSGSSGKVLLFGGTKQMAFNGADVSCGAKLVSSINTTTSV